MGQQQQAQGSRKSPRVTPTPLLPACVPGPLPAFKASLHLFLIYFTVLPPSWSRALPSVTPGTCDTEPQE